MTLSLLEFLQDTAKPEPQIWDYISPSRLNLWLKCPLAFRRRYIDGVESATSPSLFVGKVTHEVLDAVYRCAMVHVFVTEKDVPVFVDDAWKRLMEAEAYFFDDTAHEEKCRLQVTDLVKAYLAEVDIAEEKPLMVERKFEVGLYDPANGEEIGLPLLGVVDLVLDSEYGPVIVDFKTAASASYCALQHEIQLTSYAYLIRAFYGYDESALEVRQLVKTKVPKIVTHRFPPRTDEHFKRFFGLIKEYLDALDRGVFNYRPSWNCGMCEHSGLCV
jgi:hypothetical protein